MRKAFLIAASRAIASVSQAVSLILLARGITPAEFGVTSAYVSACLFIIVVVDMGVGTVLLRYGRLAVHGSVREKQIVMSAYSTSLIQALLAAVATAAASLGFPQVPYWLVVCATIWAFAERAFETIFCGLVAEGRTSRANVLLVSRRTFALAAQMILLNRGFGGTNAFAASLVVGSIVGALTLASSSLHNVSLGARPFRYPLRESLGFWVASASSQSRDLETPIVNHFADAEQAGLHSVGYRLQRPVSLLAMSLAQVVMPNVSVHQGSASREIKRIWFATAASLLLTVLAVPFSALTIEFVLGGAYLPATGVVQVSLLFAVPFAFCAPLGAVIQSLGGAAEVAVIGFVAAMLGIMAAAFGAHYMGAYGAVVACGGIYVCKYSILSVRAHWRMKPELLT